MSELLENVNQRTQLVGQNRMELLLFKLDNGRQRYAINVFKVREAQPCPKLTHVPNMHPSVRGVAHVRGQNISVIDLRQASGGAPIEDVSESFLIITEYNSSVQGFLVSTVERIINLNWENIMPPPEGLGEVNYLTSVAQVDDDLVEIIDVEKILDEIRPSKTDVPNEIREEVLELPVDERPIFIVDDSSVARKQVRRTIEQLGMKVIEAKNGREALDMLKGMTENGDIRKKITMLISDIEMPQMDGYTLCAELRNDSKLQNLHVILHTSLSGVFNKAMVDKVGADNFISKFSPELLSQAVLAGRQDIN